MRRNFLRLGLSPVIAALLLLAPAASAQTVSLTSLLQEMVDRDRIARFPDPAYTCKQFSSYDRASTGADKPETWFANGDAGKYLRIDKNEKLEGGEEFVMMDADGPGAVVRIWSANPAGTLYVYIDGGAEPALAVPMADLMGARWKLGAPLSETVARGWNLYLPIPYAKHIKVTCAGKRVKDKNGREYNEVANVYYQINYRTYAPGTSVTSFSMAQFDGAAAAINAVQTALMFPESGANDPDPIESSRPTLQPGESDTLELPPGPASVRYVAMGIQVMDQSVSVRTQALHNVVISMEFDGETTVWAPLGHFFGSGVGHNVYRDWYRSVLAALYLHSRWVMPYQKTARITLTNYGATPVTLRLRATTRRYARWDDSLMRFHCAWRSEYPIKALGGRGTEDWNYVEVQGKGVFVGDNLAVMNPVEAWWGEGDEKIYVDGEAFPSHFGTGTEDYYGYAWCSPERFTSAFHAQPRADGEKDGNNWGHTTVTRTRSLDAIPFTKSFRFDMEVWHWKACEVGYAATTYFYAMPGATTNRKPQPEVVSAPIVEPPPPPPPFKVEGAIECESLKVVGQSEGTTVTPQGGFGPGLWSGETQLWVQGHKVGDFVEIEIPVADNRPRRLSVYATRSWDYATVRFSVSGKQAGEDADLYNTKGRAVVSTGPLDLGVVTPVDGKVVLRAEIVGANKDSEGSRSYFGLDCVVLGTLP